MEQNISSQYLVRRTTLAVNRVYQFEVTLASTIGDILFSTAGPRCVTFQFIFHPNFFYIQNYLMAFDLDVVQLSYNGDRVLGTWAAIQALCTGTFLCYCLSTDIQHLGRTALRLSKYIRRGFTLLYPHDFPIDQFSSLCSGSCNNPNLGHYSSTTFKFGKNNDYFQIQKRFVQLFVDQSFI
jgi:hypothetical protein